MKKTVRILKVGLLAFGVVFAMSSCKNNKKNADQNKDANTMTQKDMNKEASKNELTDAQIASIAVTANKVDIEFAKIAEERATNDAVKKFAHTMERDHSEVIQKASDLANSLNLTPDSNNPITKKLMDMGKVTSEKLKSLSGSEFDKFYIDNEVKVHKSVIDLVGNKLIPSAQNEKLKDLLKSTVPLFKHHLDMAESVKKELGK